MVKVSCNQKPVLTIALLTLRQDIQMSKGDLTRLVYVPGIFNWIDAKAVQRLVKNPQTEAKMGVGSIFLTLGVPLWFCTFSTDNLALLELRNMFSETAYNIFWHDCSK